MKVSRSLIFFMSFFLPEFIVQTLQTETLRFPKNMRSLNPGFESRNFQDPKPLVPNIDENIYEINKKSFRSPERKTVRRISFPEEKRADTGWRWGKSISSTLLSNTLQDLDILVSNVFMGFLKPLSKEEVAHKRGIRFPDPGFFGKKSFGKLHPPKKQANIKVLRYRNEDYSEPSGYSVRGNQNPTPSFTEVNKYLQYNEEPQHQLLIVPEISHYYTLEDAILPSHLNNQPSFQPSYTGNQDTYTSNLDSFTSNLDSYTSNLDSSTSSLDSYTSNLDSYTSNLDSSTSNDHSYTTNENYNSEANSPTNDASYPTIVSSYPNDEEKLPPITIVYPEKVEEFGQDYSAIGSSSFKNDISNNNPSRVTNYPAANDASVKTNSASYLPEDASNFDLIRSKVEHENQREGQHEEVLDFNQKYTDNVHHPTEDNYNIVFIDISNNIKSESLLKKGWREGRIESEKGSKDLQIYEVDTYGSPIGDIITSFTPDQESNQAFSIQTVTSSPSASSIQPASGSQPVSISLPFTFSSSNLPFEIPFSSSELSSFSSNPSAAISSIPSSISNIAPSISNNPSSISNTHPYSSSNLVFPSLQPEISVSENFPIFDEFFTPELINIPPGAQGFTTPGPVGEEYTPFKFPEVTTYTPEETVPSTQSIVFPENPGNQENLEYNPEDDEFLAVKGEKLKSVIGNSIFYGDTYTFINKN